MAHPNVDTALAGSSNQIDADTLTTAAQWRAFADLLLRDADMIQVQLADRTRETTDGYWTWRKRANFARAAILDRYRFARRHAIELRVSEDRTPSDRKEHLGTVVREFLHELHRDPDPVVRAAGERLRALLAERAGWDFSHDEG